MEESPFSEAYSSVASQEIPAFHGTQRFITAFTTARHLSLSWAKPFQFMSPSHFLEISFNIILQSTLGLSNCLFQVSPPKPCVHLSCLPYVPHAQLTSLFLIWSPE